jgi:hypothetical protein
VTGAGAAGPRAGQCRLAACPGVPQGAMPVGGMPWGSDPRSRIRIRSRILGSNHFAFPSLIVPCCFASGQSRWEIGPFAHMCSSVVGASVGPSVVGRDWSPVSSNKARGYCCRTPGDHRAPLQPGRAARRYLRVRGAARADPQRPRAGLAPGPQVLRMAAAAMVL